MPIVTYIGRSHVRSADDPKMRDWTQNQPVEVTTAWLDKYGGILGEEDFRIEGWTPKGAEERTVDKGNDGVPDSGWNKKDIVKWLAAYDIKPSGYTTKTQLLEIVATVMSPDGVEETEELVKESAETEQESE